MKKVVALLLSAVMAIGMMAGCGTTEAPVESSVASVSEVVESEVAEVEMKIAVILPGSITDESWNHTAYVGLQAIEAMGNYETAYTENITADQAEEYFRNYCESGFDFVLGHGAQYGDACCVVAEEYPDVNFFITGNAPADIPEEELPTNIMFSDYRECEGAYVCGVVAALMTESGKVGYVGGGNNTTQQSDKNAFIEGVASIDPAIEVKTVITGTFDDTALGKETAIAMIEEGVDVILQTCDHTGLGVLEACNEKDVFCFGYTTDQSTLIEKPELVLTSMLIDIPFMISSQIDLIKAGNYGGVTFPGLHDGVVSMSAFSASVPAEVAEQVNAIVDQIKAGEIVITPNYSEN